MDWVVLIISYLFSYDLICAVRFESDGHRGEGTEAHRRARFPVSGALEFDGGDDAVAPGDGGVDDETQQATRILMVLSASSISSRWGVDSRLETVPSVRRSGRV
jgi:hypothetical protein